MAITRADIAGALKVLNANGIKDRRKHLTAMLTVEHPVKSVSKALADLPSYPEWQARMDLEEVAPDPAKVVAPPLARPRPVKKKKK